jgi:hypothetical protein
MGIRRLSVRWVPRGAIRIVRRERGGGARHVVSRAARDQSSLLVSQKSVVLTLDVSDELLRECLGRLDLLLGRSGDEKMQRLWSFLS